jgi:outer membrane protein assembly factor BamB
MSRPRTPLLLALTLLSVGCSGPELLTYTVPMQEGAPWPRFRRTADNRGWSPLQGGGGQREVWSFATGKGIFSSPVVDRDGIIYFGSADAVFYAVRPDGGLAWKQKLGELVDSAAVIGDDGTVYVGSGDGHLYAFGDGGEIRWRFKPRGGAFITWFEGNVVIGPDGALYAGNDDFHLYAVDRATGAEKWRLKGTDQVWSAAGFGPDGLLYYGANDLFLRALDPRAAAANPATVDRDALRWRAPTLGPVVSSPLVTAAGRVIVGSFDGHIHAYDGAGGQPAWKVPTREHVYASAAQAPDGTIYLPSADGTLYALGEDGAVRWSFDTLDPIRSSPAIDGGGTIYFGGGDGRLYALNPDGTRRWSFDTSEGDRNDLNGSPALGRDAIYITGEDGKLWAVPYDYCLRGGAQDRRCSTSPREELPDDGAELYRLTPGGSSLVGDAHTVAAGEALALRLVVRSRGDTVDAAIDPQSLKVTVTPSIEHEVHVAADGSFFGVVPARQLPAGTRVVVRAEGDYLVDGMRLGNMVTGGRVGGHFSRSLDLAVQGAKLAAPPLAPTADEVPVLDMLRLAVPQPVVLPSFNQIGFDFMHLLVGIIDLDASSGRTLAWVAAARVAPDGQVVIDTSADQKILFPLAGQMTGDSFVLETASFRVEFAGVDVPVDYLRLGGTLTAQRESAAGLSILGATTCGDVEYYATVLKLAGLCNPKTDQMVLLGTAQLRPASFGGKRPTGLTVDPPTLVEATETSDGSLRVTLGGALPSSEHLIGLLLLDTSGQPLPLSYSQSTRNEIDASGRITGASLALGPGDGVKAGAVELVVLHDFFPVARFRL